MQERVSMQLASKLHARGIRNYKVTTPMTYIQLSSTAEMAPQFEPMKNDLILRTARGQDPFSAWPTNSLN